jgi:surfactin synthase thioesterase subunit/phosphopantetheinyl transferase
MSSPWYKLLAARPGARRRLLILPHAGGGPSYYRDAARGIPPDFEPFVACLPGRESRFREPPIRSVTAIADELAQALSRLPDRPLTLFGHSLGARIGFELAGLLPNVELLVVAGAAAPGVAGTKNLSVLTDPELREELRRLGGTPASVLDNAELFSLLTAAIRADLEAFDRSDQGCPRPIGVPIRVLTGLADPFVPVSAIWPWRTRTTASCDFIGQVGGHFFDHDFGLDPVPRATLTFFTLRDTNDADLAVIDDVERARARRFIKPELARRFVAGRSRMRRILGAAVGTDPGELRLSTTASGKPFLADDHGTGLRFNLAHSADDAALAYDFHNDVGIDLERFRSDVDCRGLAARYFSPAEIDRLASAADPVEWFFRLWTGKEAYSKARGLGLNLPLDGYDILMNDSGYPHAVRDEMTPPWSVNGLNHSSEFAAAVATRVPVRRWRLEC